MKKDPVIRGTALQLPLYARAASALSEADSDDPVVQAAYWFAFEKGGTSIKPDLQDQADPAERFDEVVSVIAGGIRGRRIPAGPAGPPRAGGTAGRRWKTAGGAHTTPCARPTAWTPWNLKRDAPGVKGVPGTFRMTAIDQGERDRIADRLDLNLFVEAGAGTGKTSVLVERVFNTVKNGHAAIGEIAAITFTEDAASELIQRIRARFEEEINKGDSSPEVDARLRDALRDIDFAAIQTIHGFARSMLAEMPLNAGLPLILDVMDEAEARLSFDGAWDSWLEGALDDEQFVSALEKASRLGLGSPMEKLKSVARELNKNHDLLRGNAFVSGPGPDPIDFDQLRRLEESWVRLLEFCESPDDRLYARVKDSTLPLIANLVELFRQSGQGGGVPGK